MPKTTYGKWIHDDQSLPCFKLNPDAGPDYDAPLVHLISTGRLFAFVNRRGTLQLTTTEGKNGLTSLQPNTYRCRSLFHGKLIVKNESISLVPTHFEKGRIAYYGIGYAIHKGRVIQNGVKLEVTQTVFGSLDDSRGIWCELKIKNCGTNTIQGEWMVSGDLAPFELEEKKPNRAIHLNKGSVMADFPNPELGRVGIIGPVDWKGGRTYHQLSLSHSITLKPEASAHVRVWVGFGKNINPQALRKQSARTSLSKSAASWKRLIKPNALKNQPQWIQDECLWADGSLLAFTGYDSSVDETYTSLGGYGFRSFCVREAGETALVLAKLNPDLAKASLRWLAKLQYSTGDLPKAHRFVPPSPFAPKEPEDSDGEIWFLLGCLQAVKDFGSTSFLDTKIPFCAGKPATMWEHCKRSFYWIRDGVGIGTHRLIKIRQGDWNDYLSCVGREGKGESVMNTGMACRAFDLLIETAQARGETAFAHEIEITLNTLRKGVAAAFDKTHFLYGYTDAGLPFGGHDEDRVHLNAQTWACLGKCGTPAQRKQALQYAVKKCWTDIGLMLMSRPFSSPAPEDVSWCPIPEGEGENSGIWPQTVYWNVWALAEEGLTNEAMRVWKAMSLRSHNKHFPNVPYGIFNGPDCYSSKFAGIREGYSQIELIHRGSWCPMNPMVAWHSFSMKKIMTTAKEGKD